MTITQRTIDSWIKNRKFQDGVYVYPDLTSIISIPKIEAADLLFNMVVNLRNRLIQITQAIETEHLREVASLTEALEKSQRRGDALAEENRAAEARIEVMKETIVGLVENPKPED